jgi:type IV pili sensor histidine kinase/response regulator
LTHNQVVIRVADDGRGINFDKIRHRAVELGLLEAENSQFLSQEALLDCLFAPGFSTVSQVSDLSGRGLGLDIVKHLVEGLRGRLHLETQPDQGTCFVIQIPLTLNILPLLLVRSQQRLIAFPSQSILRAISLKEETHKHQVRWQEQLYPVRSLAQLLPYGQTPGRLPQENQDVGLMVNLKDQIAVLAVDQIVDERPLVVKALDAITPLPPYLIGCTVLGTGEVIPIFAPENFERLWQQLPAPLSDQERAKLTNPEPSSSDKTTILVIDDSITVRRTLQRVLSRSGYEVIQCRDGKEAWELLGRHQEPISMAFCDLEMPNMDGYSLLQLIRGDQQWRSLPVVMLTSRENETHRQRAMDLGANHYLTKPFQPNQLLALVATFVQSERS